MPQRLLRAVLLALTALVTMVVVTAIVASLQATAEGPIEPAPAPSPPSLPVEIPLPAVADGVIVLRFELRAPGDARPLWAETQSVTVSDGRLGVFLGTTKTRRRTLEAVRAAHPALTLTGTLDTRKGPKLLFDRPL